MTDETTEAPERIYLEPGEPESWDPHFGRTWCDDDVWEREADDPGVAYVRADLVEDRSERCRELLEKSHELLAEEADALTADYVALRQRIREMLTELEADDE